MLNVNIGLLGHVDSGKTALAKALSSTASTAAFDKSPQSQSRGITLDLGFSACEVSVEDGNADATRVLREADLTKVQCTLVDCPGHASLIRTVVGGAQIIDAMVLVIDATKGMQVQTAECLILGEVLAKPLVVVLNKMDAIQGASPAAKEAALAALKRKLQQVFRRTRWPTVAIVEVAAAPREVAGGIGHPLNTEAVLPQVLRAVDLAALKSAKESEAERPAQFYMLVDHCFAVRGQGTVFTGTVVAGVVRVGDTVLVPELQTTRKVKGLQVFHKPVEMAQSGDRVGLCVAQFDPTWMERGVLCSAASSGRALVSSSQLIARVHRVRYHPLPCDTHTKFHITIGHATVMGTMRYFARPPRANESLDVPGTGASFDPSIESTYVEELDDGVVASYTSTDTTASVPGRPLPVAPAEQDYYAVLLLERPVLAAPGVSMIAMRLDVERENFCRIALAGTVCHVFMEDGAAARTTTAVPGRSDHSASHGQVPAWRRLPVVRYRYRALRVDRVLDSRSCIADGVVSLQTPGAGGSGSRPAGASAGARRDKGCVNAEARQRAELFTEVQKFLRLVVVFEPEDADAAMTTPQPSNPGAVKGIIDSSFGKTGKVKLVFDGPVFADPAANAATAPIGSFVSAARKKRNKSTRGPGSEDAGCSGGVFLRPGRILLVLKKYPFALHSGLEQ
ncbi:SELB / selenocysteine-specific elongation factor [Leishmania donovani]|uniref:Selenocysteine-specific_elongation_factor_putativ e/GeneDB:LmjF.34.2840 n=1 Tax=Leishmania donovani TaxID=5661 RepID=A0A6J8FLC0_LEIDO|nr:SELB / selenocysteine-specific elongation factor [Leishmania donovani]VDZ48476.1 selenocysteine-specific_elongation_factor_putative/GeneDB:LmjF.34.2840 [Leishmania donovani]